MKPHEEGYSMPLGAPLYAPPPFGGGDRGGLILMTYRADPDEVAWEVPEPLEPAGDGLMFAWASDLCQPPHTMDLYHECVLGIKIRYRDIEGWYVPYIFVDHDMAMTFEREIYGWPAAICDSTPLEFHGSQIIGNCVRYGEKLMHLSMNVTSEPPERRTADVEGDFWKQMDGTFLQLRKLPHPAKDGKPIRQLLDVPPRDMEIKEIWQGGGTLELGKSGLFHHMHKLNPVEVLGTWFLRSRWVLHHPEVIWEG